jgi:hypothetical protein
VPQSQCASPLVGEGVGHPRRPFLKKNAEAELRLCCIERCDPGEGVSPRSGIPQAMSYRIRRENPSSGANKVRATFPQGEKESHRRIHQTQPCLSAPRTIIHGRPRIFHRSPRVASTLGRIFAANADVLVGEAEGMKALIVDFAEQCSYATFSGIVFCENQSAHEARRAVRMIGVFGGHDVSVLY